MSVRETQRQLLQALGAAETLPALGQVCRRGSAWLGFEHSLYALRYAPAGHPLEQVILYGYPESWQIQYDQQGYLLVDPVLARAMTSVAPIAWDDLPRDSGVVRRLFEEAAGHGLAHGLTVPLHGTGEEFGLLCLARQRPLPAPGSRERLFQRAQWWTAQLQMRLRAVLDRSVHRVPFPEPQARAAPTPFLHA